jgi:hypothetical protein
MLNAGVLKYDATGRIRNTTAAPTERNAAVGCVQGLLSQAAASPVNIANGMGFTATGALAIDTAGAITHHAQGALPMTAASRLAVAVNGTVAYREAGLPFSSTGRLALATAEAPVLLDAFSNGFSSGFQ